MAEVIVPIRFDLEVDGKFLKDAFCWNAHESQDSLEEFAVGLIKDTNLPQVRHHYNRKASTSQPAPVYRRAGGFLPRTRRAPRAAKRVSY